MLRRGNSDIDIFMPISPAPPHSSAHTDHSDAALTPKETSVSMVDEPYRAARAAARWNGQAPHVTTGNESAAMIHCQPANCRGGTIESTSTGVLRIADTMSRVRSPSDASASGFEVSKSPASV